MHEYIHIHSSTSTIIVLMAILGRCAFTKHIHTYLHFIALDRDGVDWIRKNVAGVGKAAHLQEGPGRYVDTSTGTTHHLLTSGLYPNYIFKKVKYECNGVLSYLN